MATDAPERIRIEGGRPPFRQYWYAPGEQEPAEGDVEYIRADLCPPQQDAEPVEGDPWEIEGLHPELWERLVPGLRRIARIMDDPPDMYHWLTSQRATVREAANSIERLRAEVRRLRTRVQPRRVSREEFESAVEEGALAIMQTKAGPSPLNMMASRAALSSGLRILGLQIEGEDDHA